MKCPVCRAIYRPSKIGEDSRLIASTCCHRCGVDLAPLICLHDLALWHHREAIQSFKSGDLMEAISQNKQAIALYSSNADFYVLAGQAFALLGEFEQADFGNCTVSLKSVRQVNISDRFCHIFKTRNFMPDQI
jgi:hypothetical protein